MQEHKKYKKYKKRNKTERANIKTIIYKNAEFSWKLFCFYIHVCFIKTLFNYFVESKIKIPIQCPNPKRKMWHISKKVEHF